MIVKNESRVIIRLLDSLINSKRRVVDYVSILDTGSTDNTIELIEHWGRDHNIPTVVHRGIFVNFGVSRTESFRLAKKTFPQADYLLLLDADFRLIIKSWNNPKLTKDYYMIQQNASGLKYWNTRLIKLSLDWECVGVTHEYWKAPDNSTGDKLYCLQIEDIGDGGCKGDKYIRDTRLLKQGLADPNLDKGLRERYYFYLAQTYKCRSKYEKAIEYYKKRIELGGWHEEVFYAMYQLANCLMSLGKEDEAVVKYLEAWEFRPCRIEPLVDLARYYRNRRKYNLALLFAIQAKQINLPDDILFLDTKYWDYLVDFEISISAWYCNKKQLGKKACEAILNSNAPDNIKKRTRSNLKFYE